MKRKKAIYASQIKRKSIKPASGLNCVSNIQISRPRKPRQSTGFVTWGQTALPTAQHREIREPVPCVTRHGLPGADGAVRDGGVGANGGGAGDAVSLKCVG